jgi:hypothetical protein
MLLPPSTQRRRMMRQPQAFAIGKGDVSSGVLYPPLQTSQHSLLPRIAFAPLRYFPQSIAYSLHFEASSSCLARWLPSHLRVHRILADYRKSHLEIQICRPVRLGNLQFQPRSLVPAFLLQTPQYSRSDPLPAIRLQQANVH